jgi:hypothetical protein
MSNQEQALPADLTPFRSTPARPFNHELVLANILQDQSFPISTIEARKVTDSGSVQTDVSIHADTPTRILYTTITNNIAVVPEMLALQRASVGILLPDMTACVFDQDPVNNDGYKRKVTARYWEQKASHHENAIRRLKRKIDGFEAGGAVKLTDKKEYIKTQHMLKNSYQQEFEACQRMADTLGELPPLTEGEMYTLTEGSVGKVLTTLYTTPGSSMPLNTNREYATQALHLLDRLNS